MAAIYPLSLHDALPISNTGAPHRAGGRRRGAPARSRAGWAARPGSARSEEHTSELQSLTKLVCRLLLEKKNDVNAYYVHRVRIRETRLAMEGAEYRACL